MNTPASSRESSNYLCSTGDEPVEMLEPLAGYASKPLVSVEEACQPLHSIIPQLNLLIHAAQNRPGNRAEILTADESAAIRLYTTQSNVTKDGLNMSLYASLNRTLRDRDRSKLAPWMSYLKLLLTALTKLPPTSAKIVWRGVRHQNSAEYIEGDEKIWWGFSSCTKSLNVLDSNLFLSQTGKRIIFSIETFDGRAVKDYSEFPQEDEVLLLPGTCLKVHAKLNPANDLHIIELKQLHPKQQLIERPVTANEPFTHTIAAGETFWTLSIQYNCKVDDIAAMNRDVECTKLQIGQVIRIPVTFSKSQWGANKHEDGDFISYTVFEQDTLERIAEWFHCTIKDLLELNPNIRSELIYPGQQLRLPRNERTQKYVQEKAEG